MEDIRKLIVIKIGVYLSMFVIIVTYNGINVKRACGKRGVSFVRIFRRIFIALPGAAFLGHAVEGFFAVLFMHRTTAFWRGFHSSSIFAGLWLSLSISVAAPVPVSSGLLGGEGGDV